MQELTLEQRRAIARARARERAAQAGQSEPPSDPPALDRTPETPRNQRFETARQATYNTLTSWADSLAGVDDLKPVSGIVRGATELAMGDRENAQSALPGFTGTTASGAAFGFQDELQGVAAGALQPVRQAMGDPMSAGQARHEQTLAAREDLEQTRSDYPVSSFASELAGGVASGGGAGMTLARNAPAAGLAMQNLIRNAPRLTGIGGGAAGGFVGGVGEGEGNFKDRLMSGAMGAVLGGGLGYVGAEAVPLAQKAGGFIGRRLGLIDGEAIEAAPRLSSEERRLARDAGLTPERAAELPAEATGPAMLADEMGSAGEELMIGAGQGGDAAADLVSDAVNARRAGRVERVMGRIQEMTGNRRGVAAIADQRAAEEQARPLFNAVDQATIPVSGSLRELVRAAQSEGVDIARTAGRQARGELGLDALLSDQDIPAGAVSGQSVRALIADVEDAANTAFRQGGGNSGSRLSALARDLRGYLGDEVPQFREASSLWRSARLDEEARNLGTRLFQGGTRRAEIETAINDFMQTNPSQSERGQFLSGILDAVEGRMDNAAEGGNPVSRLDRRGVIERLRLVFGEDADVVADALSDEMQMSRVENAASPLVNSATAVRQRGEERFNRVAAGPVRNAAAGALDALGNVRDAVTLRQPRERASEAMRRGSEQTRMRMAEALVGRADQRNPLVAKLVAEMNEADRQAFVNMYPIYAVSPALGAQAN